VPGTASSLAQLSSAGQITTRCQVLSGIKCEFCGIGSMEIWIRGINGIYPASHLLQQACQKRNGWHREIPAIPFFVGSLSPQT
jgi:hypothetical protein